MKSSNDNICEWRENYGFYWESTCGHYLKLDCDIDTPRAEEMKYCCYCGKELKEVRCEG
jgi:hypothetical protein